MGRRGLQLSVSMSRCSVSPVFVITSTSCPVKVVVFLRSQTDEDSVRSRKFVQKGGIKWISNIDNGHLSNQVTPDKTVMVFNPGQEMKN